MSPDGLGFKYPHVIEDKCIDCGLCEKVCPLLNGAEVPQEPILCAAMRHNDMTELMSSRSGGVFPELARLFIDMGGAVYGAGFDEEFRVVHKRAADMDSIQEFRGSKYVQSELGDSFKEVLNDLKSGKHVLFTGTPCQCAGLKSFIPGKYADRLYLVDLICHGVPSPSVWKDNLMFQQKRLSAPIKAISFRDKKLFGWTAHRESYMSEEESVTDDFFTFLFYRHIMFRDSCHSCPYASVSRVGDLTLGDFWGWEKVHPEMNTDDRGVSLILINTEKGTKMLDDVAGSFQVAAVSLSECMQPNLVAPSSVGKDRENFVRDYTGRGFKYIVKRYSKDSMAFKIKSLYLKVLRKIKVI